MSTRQRKDFVGQMATTRRVPDKRASPELSQFRDEFSPGATVNDGGRPCHNKAIP